MNPSTAKTGLPKVAFALFLAYGVLVFAARDGLIELIESGWPGALEDWWLEVALFSFPVGLIALAFRTAFGWVITTFHLATLLLTGGLLLLLLIAGPSLSPWETGEYIVTSNQVDIGGPDPFWMIFALPAFLVLLPIVTLPFLFGKRVRQACRMPGFVGLIIVMLGCATPWFLLYRSSFPNL